MISAVVVYHQQVTIVCGCPREGMTHVLFWEAWISPTVAVWEDLESALSTIELLLMDPYPHERPDGVEQMKRN